MPGQPVCIGTSAQTLVTRAQGAIMNDKSGEWNAAVDETAQSGQASISADGLDRRGFLKCMAWAGTGLVWSFAGGVPVSHAFGGPKHGGHQVDFSFVQISDSHIGFNKPANTDVTATLQAALDRISAVTSAPDFLIHT